MQKSAHKIGVFDSGVGGLTTLASLRAAMPTYDYHYLGDVARAPYGTKTQDELLQYVREAVNYLRACGCTLVVIACNTASTHAMKVLQAELLPVRGIFRLLGILTPVVEAAIETTRNKRIGVIATEATVASTKYPREVAKFRSDVTVYQQATPTLASLIENRAGTAEIHDALQTAITPLLTHDIDTLVLGCTHYGYVAHTARELLPAHIQLVHEGMCIADSLRDYLERHADFAKNLSTNGSTTVETTKMTDAFVYFAHTRVPTVPVHIASIV